jgi:hypothetical protein
MTVIELNSRQFLVFMEISHGCSHTVALKWLGKTVEKEIEGFTWLVGRTFMVY